MTAIAKYAFVGYNIRSKTIWRNLTMRFLLEGDTPPSMWSTVIIFVAMIAIFYFLMYRPQKKQDQQQQQMRNSLEVGDEITTIGGIIGRIVSIKDETLVIETSKERTKIRILRTAVRNVDVKAEDSQG